MKILSVDVAKKAGITYYKDGDYNSCTYEMNKSMTIKDIINDWEHYLREADVLLLEWQNDQWSGVRATTQQVLQQYSYIWWYAILHINPTAKVEWVRKSTVTPLLKSYVKFDGRKRAELKRASVAAYNIVFRTNETSDDLTDSYWFVKSYLLNNKGG